MSVAAQRLVLHMVARVEQVTITMTVVCATVVVTSAASASAHCKHGSSWGYYHSVSLHVSCNLLLDCTRLHVLRNDGTLLRDLIDGRHP